MKFSNNNRFPLVYTLVLLLISLDLVFPKSIPKVVNDGYGDYVLVPAGKFLMGDNLGIGNSWEQPVHAVNLDSFYIGKYEITNKEFKKFIDAGGYSDSIYWADGYYGRFGDQPKCWTSAKHRGGGIAGNENFPVVGVSLFEAKAYCKWLSIKTGQKYRLPTEAEWEKAARGTDQRTYPWGNEIDSSYANYYTSGDPFENDSLPLGGFTPVGYYNGNTYGNFTTHDNASPYGAYDMSGNVFEWVSDQFSASYYSNSPINNPTGPPIGEYTPFGSKESVTGDFGNIRGGFWTDNHKKMVMKSLRSASRSIRTKGQSERMHRTGFRCVREVD